MGQRDCLFILSSFVIAAFLIGAGGADARSKKILILTKDNVTEFVQDVSAMTSHQNIDRDDTEISAYLTRHIDEKARFKTSITYAIPGMPPQTKALALKKSDYIQQVRKGSDSVEHYHSEIKVDHVKISKNKKKASVKTTSTESGVMMMPDESGNTQEVPIEGISKCFQVLKLGKSGYIQMYSANCKTTMRFLEN